MKPSAAVNQAPLSGFSAEQTSFFFKLIQAVCAQPVGLLHQPVQPPIATPPLLVNIQVLQLLL